MRKSEQRQWHLRSSKHYFNGTNNISMLKSTQHQIYLIKPIKFWSEESFIFVNVLLIQCDCWNLCGYETRFIIKSKSDDNFRFFLMCSECCIQCAWDFNCWNCNTTVYQDCNEHSFTLNWMKLKAICLFVFFFNALIIWDFLYNFFHFNSRDKINIVACNVNSM